MTKTIKKAALTLLSVLALLCMVLLAGCNNSKLIKLSFETDGGTAVAAIEAEAGEDITDQLPEDPVKQGYKFGGWYLEADCSGTQQTLPTTMPEKSVTYYAKWTEVTLSELTLSAGNGGSLTTTSYQVEEGTNLLTFLADKAPTPDEGLTFGGWFRGGKQITDTDTMPATALSLTAKYLASYTVSVYEMDSNGAYPAEAKTETGSGWYREPFEYTAPSGFSIDETQEGSYALTDSLGKGEQFTVWLSRNKATIGFQVNLSGGSYGTMQSIECYVGSTVTLPDGSAFGAPEDLRFAGWARTSSGKVEFLPNEEVNTEELFGEESLVILYARWEEGILDVFSGSDLLYVGIADTTKVHLLRGPFEFEGDYDPATGVFSFEDGALEGKVVNGRESGTQYFFFFRDLEGETVQYGGGSEDTLTFTEADGVVYKKGTEEIEGVYGVDALTGEFIFDGKDASGKQETFHFTVNTQTTEEGVSLVFNRETGEERGFYAYRDRAGEPDFTRLFFLDGMVDENGIGGFYTYSYDSSKASLGFEKCFTVEQVAYYSKQTNGDYAIVSSTGSQLFLLKTYSYNGSVGGLALAGVAGLSDGLNGSYVNYDDMWETESPASSLTLDGFGGGTYKGQTGTYELKTRTLNVFSTSSGNYTWEDAWIVFTAADGAKTIIRPEESLYGSIYYVLEQEPYFEQWKDASTKAYGVFDGSLPQNAAFYHYVDNDAIYVFAWYADTQTGQTVYELIDQGMIAQDESSSYLVFSSASIPAQYGFDFGYYVRSVSEGGSTLVEVSIPYGEEIHAPALADLYEETAADALTVDMWGTLTYGGKTYAYGDWMMDYLDAYWAYYELGYTDSYNLAYFITRDGLEIFCMYAEVEGEPDEDGEPTIEALYYVLNEGSVITLERSGADPAPYLWFIGDKTLAISLFDADDLESREYLFFGSYVYDEDGGFYTFTPDEEVDVSSSIREDLYALFFEYGFVFQVTESETGVKEAAIYFDYNYVDLFSAENEDGSTFELDGFGGAAYLPAPTEEVPEPAQVKGTYEFVSIVYNDSYTIYAILTFTTDTEVKYVLITYAMDPETYEATITFMFAEGNEAGVYDLCAGDSVYSNAPLLFFGDATADKPGTVYDGYYDAIGTYKATGRTFEYFLTKTQFTEYELSFPALNATYKAALSHVMAEGDELAVYIEARGLASGTFTADTGTITADGFCDSFERGDRIYYGYSAYGNYTDDTVFANAEEFEADPDGKQFIFFVEYVSIEGVLYSYDASIPVIFDVDKEDRTKLTERDSYAGSYVPFIDGDIGEGKLVLDGHGNATMYDANDTVTQKGTYTYNEEDEDLIVYYTYGDHTYRFVLSIYTVGNESYRIFNDMDFEQVYRGPALSVLMLTGLHANEAETAYVDALYIDSYGVSREGLYSMYTDELVFFQGMDNSVFYFRLNGENFSVVTDDFVMDDGILFAYQGPTSVETLKIPDGVTEIADEVFAFMYKIGSLDLNEVEKIGNYAFYSVRELLQTTLVSEKLTYIGDYAFASFMRYAVGDTLYCRSLINYIDLPNVTYIGDNAFYGNTSLSVTPGDFEGYGNVKLKAIETIGDGAFRITRFGEKDKVLYLDLTEADLTKLTIAGTAFDVHPSSAYGADELGYPVCIRVNANGAFTFLSKLAEKYRGNVEIVGLGDPAALAETGWYSFTQSSYLLFNAEKGELGLNTATLYAYSSASYEWTTSEMLYSVGTDGTVTLYANEDGQWSVQATFTLAADAVTLTMDEATYYKAETEQSVTINGTTPLTFTYEVFVSTFMFGGTEIEFTFTSANYNGKAAENPEFNIYDNSLELEYAEGNETYTVQIDLAALTAGDASLASRTVYSKDNDYRATFSGAVELNTEKESFYHMSSLEKKGDGDAWTRLGSETAQRQEDGKGGYTYTVKNTLTDGSEETYTVVYHRAEGDAAAYIEVSVTTLHALRNVQAKEAETYRADFKYSGDTADKMDSLTAFYVYKDYGDYKSPEEVYGADIKKTAENTFTVTVSSGSGVTTYTVVFHAKAGEEDAYIVVTKAEQKVVTVETKHGDNEDYYTIDIIVGDDNKIVGVTGELKSWSYDNYWQSYESFTVATLSDAENVKIEGMVVTFEYFGTKYTVTFTYENNAFSATLDSTYIG